MIGESDLKLNLFSIIIMMVAIGLGNVVGNMVAGMIGMAGGIIGSMIVGFVIYVIFAFLSGMSIKLFAGIVFAIFVWLANMLAGLISGWTGFGGGIIGLLISALVLSFLWSNWGASMAGQSKRSTGKRRRRRR
jgi:hypothetical protein